MKPGDLPGNWEAGIGERSDQHYTKWFYEPDQNLKIEVYWDEGVDGSHKVVLRSDEKDEHGDRKNPYPKQQHYEKSEPEAEARAIKVMREYVPDTGDKEAVPA